jgi:hypothetical protein
MSWGYVAVAAATVVSGYMASEAQEDAAAAQERYGNASIDEARRQFDNLQELLKPYSEAGAQSLAGQQMLLGLAGPEAQQAAIDQIEQSPQFQSLVQQGEESILQNASATGGLRGGNTQAALAQFRPQMLSDAIQRQYANLGGITSLGQNAAAMTGNAGMQTAASIGGTYGQIGQAQAAGALGQASTYGNTLNTLAGLYAGSQQQPQQQSSGGGGGGGGLLGGLGGGLGGLF